MSHITREPVGVTNAALAMIQAVLGALIACGVWKATPEQVASMLAVAAAIFALVNILIVRPQVTPLVDPRDSMDRSLRPVVRQ